MATARLRVAIVRQRYDPLGGAERHIARLLPALERAGIEPTLISRRAEGWGARRFIAANPPYLGSTWRDASFARAARRAWQAGGFDLVQSHERIPGCDIYRAGDGVHAEWLQVRGGALRPYHRYVCAAERRLFAHPGLRAVICNSAMVRDEIVRRFAIAPQKLHVISGGVDLDFFHPRQRASARAAGRAELAAGEAESVFLFVGSGFWRKGLDAAIAALALCRNARFRLVVAGRDRQAARFGRQARKAGLGDRVRFLGARADVRSLYAAADCFILPTRYDPLPGAALEALAMGLPAIVGRRSGAAELVRHGESGWICDPEDVGGLARQMEAAAHAAASAGVAEAARSAVKRCGIEDMTHKLVDLYGALAEAAPAGGRQGAR